MVAKLPSATRNMYVDGESSSDHPSQTLSHSITPQTGARGSSRRAEGSIHMIIEGDRAKDGLMQTG